MGKLKGFFVGLAALGLAAFAPAAAHAAVCGDLNGNGVLDAGDTVILTQRVFGGVSAADCGGLGTLQCGDMNGTGTVTVADLVVLLNAVAGNPVVFNCAAQGTPVCNVTRSSSINANETWQSGCTTTINGTTFVQPGVIVTVQPGARVEGVKGAATPSVLVFLPGSKINAAGTPAQPIVMTSNQPDGSRGIGDWGGLVLNGKAPVNCPTGKCLAEGLTGIEFGGTDPNDSSGVVQYTRIEFSGIELSADNELNIFTQNGIGRGTLVDHVQCNHGFDDCFEWFGGTVNEKFLVASSCGDDDFDWQLGYVGSVQFGLSIKDASNSDNNGRHGFEADNNETGFNFLPRSNPKFCNITTIGTVPQGQTGTGRRGALLRRGTAGKIYNTIIDGYTQSAIQLDDNATAEQACVNATTLKTTEPFLRVQDSILFGNTALASGSATAPCTGAQWVGLLQAGANVSTADPNLNELSVGYPVTTPLGASAADGYVPTAAGLVPSQDCTGLDPSFFTAAPYVGAFAPGTGSAGNWLRDAGAGTAWINFDTN